MKVKDIFKYKIANPLSFSRRDSRNRRERHEFRRLDSSDIPDVHFKRNTQSGNSNESTQQKLISIELDNLKGTTSMTTDASSSSGLRRQRESTQISNEENLTTHTDQRVDPFEIFNVYNPTSEELSSNHQDDWDDVFPFTLSNVKLKFREIISAGDRVTEGGGLPEDNEEITFSPFSPYREAANRKKKCCWNLCYVPGIPHAVFLFITLITIFCAIFVTIYVVSRDRNTVILQSISDLDLEIVSRNEWLLPDIESKQQRNLSKTQLELEKFRSLNLDMHNNSRNKKLDAGFLILKGHLANKTTVEEIFHEAEVVLKEKLHANSTELEILSWKGIATKLAMKELTKRFNISQNNHSFEGFFSDNLCHKEINLNCNKTSWYRSINGSCNNVIHKTWGSSLSPFRRVINPVVEKAEKQARLPLAESVSAAVTKQTPVPDPEVSAILPLWGLFVLHDTVKMAESPVDCCSTIVNQSNHNHVQHDGIHAHANKIKEKVCSTIEPDQRCTAASSSPAIFPTCKIEPRTSFNLATSFIDASNIYGSSEEKTSKLRLKRLGRMKVTVAQHTRGKGFLPLAKDQNETCVLNGKDMGNCFLSGDDDVNQLSALTALNTIFLRQHNWIAFWLNRLNSHWDDERIFQESRRILIAQIQHITYNEFLPQILGSELMKLSGLHLYNDGYYENFNPQVNPSVSDEFAGAVGYFWYSMAVGKLKSIWKKDKIVRKVKYHIDAQILSPEFLVKGRGHFEAILRGFMNLAVNRVGVQFDEQLRSLYVKPLNVTVDIIKMILEKGRNLELAPYIEWRKAYGFPIVKRFQDIQGDWYPEAYATITNVYKTVSQVDLFTGMLAEIPIPSARVGPTLAYLLTDQFLRFKRGDRFWYENNVYFHHFREAQLKSIRQTTLARIICDNTDRDFDQIQKWPMLLTSPQSNPLLSCSDLQQLPNVQLQLWITGPEQTREFFNDSNDSDMDQSDTWDLETEELDETQSDDNDDNKVRIDLQAVNKKTDSAVPGTSSSNVSKNKNLHLYVLNTTGIAPKNNISARIVHSHLDHNINYEPT